MTIWNRAKWTQDTYRTVRTVKPIVGITTEEVVARGIDVNWNCCRKCGHHVCSCVKHDDVPCAQCRAQYPNPSRSMCEARHGGKQPPMPDPGYLCRSSAVPIGTLEPLDLNSTLDAPTPGTFAWLKTLAPETQVTRPCWQKTHGYDASEIVYAVENDGKHDAWRKATDWQLFEVPPAIGSFAWLKTLPPETRVRLPSWRSDDHESVEYVLARGTLEWANGRRYCDGENWQLFEEKPSACAQCKRLAAVMGNLIGASGCATEACVNFMRPAAPSFSPGDRVRHKESNTFGNIVRTGDTCRLLQVTTPNGPREWAPNEVEHARKPEPARGETLMDRCSRLRPIAKNKELAYATALITNPAAQPAGQVGLTVSCPGHVPVHGVVTPMCTDEEIIRLWAELITWCSGHRVAEMQKPATQDGLSAQERETVRKLTGMEKPAPLDDEALVLIYLDFRRKYMRPPGEYDTEATRAAYAKWHDAIEGMGNEQSDRIRDLADNDDARLVEMWRTGIATPGGEERRSASRKYYDKIRARIAIGDTDVGPRIERLANAK